MSARSRKQWQQGMAIGWAAAAYQLLNNLSDCQHLCSSTRSKASTLASEVAKLQSLVKAESVRTPTELSAKKGT